MAIKETEFRAMSIGVVIPTLGNRDSLATTLQSLTCQTVQPVEIVVVNQGSNELLKVILEEFKECPVRLVNYEPGVSRARNFGIRLLTSEATYVATIDDDIYLSPDCLERLLWRMQHEGEMVSAVSGKLVDTDTGASRLSFSEKASALTRRTVWTSAIEATTLYSRVAIEEVGLFDETLGLGSRTPWGSGEGTDLLLRLMRNGSQVWFEPSALMFESIAEMSREKSILRVERYACGTGRVFAKNYSKFDQLILVMRSIARLLLCAVKPRQCIFERAILRGRIDGLRKWSSPSDHCSGGEPDVLSFG